jgi:outer membrane protein assembly factor BamE (lipoprotein component of BamABCDE complex)
MKIVSALLLAVLALIAAACTQTQIGQNLNEEQMSIAKVQREIRIGMSSTEVVEVLGSPNMVTTDDARRETWVYDRVSTQISSSQAQAGIWLVMGVAGVSNSNRSQNQRTLTIIIKFDENNKVRDFAYRTATF